MQDLLRALAKDLDLQKDELATSKNEKNLPLSEEDLLKKPFYTVEESSETLTNNNLNQQMFEDQNFLPSLVESQSENYRELLPHLLLSVQIKEPMQLQNLTVSCIFQGCKLDYHCNL